LQRRGVDVDYADWMVTVDANSMIAFIVGIMPIGLQLTPIQ